MLGLRHGVGNLSPERVAVDGAGFRNVAHRNGNVVETISGGLINGPWDSTAYDQGSKATLFVTNVLNGTVAGGGSIVNEGTVVRIVLTIPYGSMPVVESMVTVGSGFSERTDPDALVIGPTGAGLSPDNTTLYVADSINNRIAAIAGPVTRGTSAGVGTTISQNGSLSDPLGLFVAPNGNILTTNGNNGFMVQTTPAGSLIKKALLDHSGSPPGAGALFGLFNIPDQGVYYVDDATNTLNLYE